MTGWQSDEALARQLQAEEELQYAREQQQQEILAAQGQDTGLVQFQRQLEGCVAQVLEYEDETLQAQALSLLPDDILAAIGAEQQEEDQLAKRLLSFFKNEFFTWVNNVKCSTCGSERTQAVGRVQPASQEEFEGRAQMVEIYKCIPCGASTRFPRYNAPGKLLETRMGRCGEWANCFTLMCRAVGLEARFARCWEDHVFTEFYSNYQQRWIHMDPCENEFDKPLLYEEGWGKSWSYVIGFGRFGVTDVSLRYSKDHAATKSRQQSILEPSLVSERCQTLTKNLRQGLSRVEARVWADRDAQEAAGLERREAVPETPLPGRQTGSTAWRAARGELGKTPTDDRLPNNIKPAESAASPSDTLKAVHAENPEAVQAASVQPDATSGVPSQSVPVLQNSQVPDRLSRASVQQASVRQPVETPHISRRITGLDKTTAVVRGADTPSEAVTGGEEEKSALSPQAPRKAMARPRETPPAGTPVATPMMNLGTRMGQQQRNGAGLSQASGWTISKQVGLRNVSGDTIGAQLQQKPMEKEAFAKDVRAAFEKIMAEGKVTANQAAVLALDAVKKRYIA